LRSEERASESRWAVPVAISSFVAVAVLIVSGLVSGVSGDGEAEILRSTQEHHGSVVTSGAMQAIGFALLAIPLFYLFRAARARSERVRGQLVGLVLVAPLFLAASGALSIGVRTDAADSFVAGEAKSTLSPKEAREQCASQRKDESAADFRDEFEPKTGETPLAACESRKRADEAASNAMTEASLAPLTSGLGLAGALGLAVALFYTALWAMRTGLLTKFWGALGMVSGIAFVLGPLYFVTLVFFVYLGLLMLGAVPGGRPPAWAAGEAIPWPTPGEQAAEQLRGPDTGELEPEESGTEPTSDGGEPADGGDGGAPERPRKRKQRD
jgi:hypothetical protein